MDDHEKSQSDVFRRSDDHAMLQRIDERTLSFSQQIADIKQSMGHLKNELDKYVLHARFSPVEKGFYGLAAIIVAAVVSSIVALVIKK